MRRVVSVLEVADPAMWDRLTELADPGALDGEALSDTRRVVGPEFDRAAPDLLGDRLLVRYARRNITDMAQQKHDLEERIGRLPRATTDVLYSAQRHALDGVVVGIHAWDPADDAHHVRALHGAGLFESIDPDAIPYAGRYRLNPDLPPPPTVAMDFAEAVMEETDDLSVGLPGPASILHDAAGLAAALDRVEPRRTHKGTHLQAGHTQARKAIG